MLLPDILTMLMISEEIAKVVLTWKQATPGNHIAILCEDPTQVFLTTRECPSQGLLLCGDCWRWKPHILN